MTKYKGYIIDRDDLGRLYIYNTSSPYSEENDRILISAKSIAEAKKIISARIESGQDVRSALYL